MSLRLDWCSHEAAKFAVINWHYSKSMPAGKVTRLGAWEDERYVGCVLFARGSNKHLGHPFGLGQTECVELVRVALKPRETPTSRIVALSCRMLRKQAPGLRLIISFADMAHGHVGTIYQAGGWVYSGVGTDDSRSRPYRAPDGQIQHWRTVAGTLAKRGMPSTVEAACRLGFTPQEKHPKHRYLYGLDAEMRARIAPLAKPYPKRVRSIDSDAPGFQSGEGGAIPTRTLHD